jgi:hypothetical protein
MGSLSPSGKGPVCPRTGGGNRSALASRAAGGETMLAALSRRCRTGRGHRNQLGRPAAPGRGLRLTVNHVSIRGTGAEAGGSPPSDILHKYLKYMGFPSEENFTVERNHQNRRALTALGGGPTGLSKGFSTHDRISPVARLSARPFWVLSARGRALLVDAGSVPWAGRRSAHPEFQTAISWLTSRSSRRRHGVPMTTPPRP